MVSGSSPNKRRKSTPDTMGSDEGSAPKRTRFGGGDVRTGPSSQQTVDATEPSRLLGLPTPIPAPPLPGQTGREGEAEVEPEPEVQSRQSTVSGADEVAEVYTETRMLQDPTGRLCT